MNLLTIGKTDELHTEAIEAMQAGDMMFIDWSTPFLIQRDKEGYAVSLAFGMKDGLTEVGKLVEGTIVAFCQDAEAVHEVVGEYLLK